MQLTAEAVYDRIIWSADVDDDDAMLAVVDEAPRLTHIKVDRLYVARNGYGIFAKLAERGRKAFYDAKCIEIPSKLEGLAQTECHHQGGQPNPKPRRHRRRGHSSLRRLNNGCTSSIGAVQR